MDSSLRPSDVETAKRSRTTAVASAQALAIGQQQCGTCLAPYGARDVVGLTYTPPQPTYPAGLLLPPRHRRPFLDDEMNEEGKPAATMIGACDLCGTRDGGGTMLLLEEAAQGGRTCASPIRSADQEEAESARLSVFMCAMYALHAGCLGDAETDSRCVCCRAR